MYIQIHIYIHTCIPCRPWRILQVPLHFSIPTGRPGLPCDTLRKDATGRIKLAAWTPQPPWTHCDLANSGGPGCHDMATSDTYGHHDIHPATQVSDRFSDEKISNLQGLNFQMARHCRIHLWAVWMQLPSRKHLHSELEHHHLRIFNENSLISMSHIFSIAIC